MWWAESGVEPTDSRIQVGDYYRGHSGSTYQRVISEDTGGPTWRRLSYLEADAITRMQIDPPLTEHEQYYLRQSLGLSDDVPLED